MASLKSIQKNGLCLGCGLCESLGKTQGYSMQLEKNGFYNVSVPAQRDASFERQIGNICPGVKVVSEGDGIWGNVLAVHSAWSTDTEIRHKGSSGGVISGIAVHLLESGTVQAVLQVGKSDSHFLHNELHVSRNRADVLACASSRYAPAPVFSNLLQILDSIDGRLAFIGKPCDIAGLRNFLAANPRHADRFLCTISIFCAGMPSYNATMDLLKESGENGEPSTLKYRGDGWPGFFEATYPSGNRFQLKYNDSWGRTLGRNIHFRCKICPDGIGLLADIAVGDAWETADGYPDFEEREGRSFVLVRSEVGRQILLKAMDDRSIASEPLEISKIASMQPYQHQRRIEIGYRVFASQIASGFALSFKNFGFLKLIRNATFKAGYRNLKGTLYRHWLWKRSFGDRP